MSGEEAVEVSALEQQRLTNIARNAQCLRDLGISVVSSRGDRVVKTSKPSRKRPVVEEQIAPSRRSTRIATLKEVDYKEAWVPSSGSKHEPKDIEQNHDTVSANVISGDVPVGTFTGAVTTDSDRSLTSAMQAAELQPFLTTQLGQTLEEFGKAAVMQIANGGKVPRFNKYSGVAEWSNSLFLWVNIDGGTGYDNAFSERGRQMMWYGGSKMHKESRVVERLYAAGMGTGPETVLLFVRREGEPYCCLGRLKCVAADLERHPIAMKWELLDYDELAKDSKYFASLL